jgi:leucine-rich repeat protein SHOC2
MLNQDPDPDLHLSALVLLPGSAKKPVRIRNTANNRIELTSLLGTLYDKNELKEEWLWFRHNRLTEIPAVVYRLVSLTTLYMRFNRWGLYIHILYLVPTEFYGSYRTY